MPAPQNKSELCTFLGMVDYVRRFISDWGSLTAPLSAFTGKTTKSVCVVNAAIHHVLISPLLGYFEDKSLSFAFALQNEAGSKLGNTIVQFPDPAQLTHLTHACGK
ncbi:hypothetical protein DSO57_1032248 [Entomophthora muscae]|uniref:Uncharacterized protein n=1 Tax=Entomophthora muscae TaxID=34485 RepID=A0ACC2S2L0_9FUNG|nr:hypothetical protein DSO57_1032248 [Entomophthora muscae]